MAGDDTSDLLAPADSECDLGVLFVHGIGSQQRGATLSQFGGAVFDWLRVRFEGIDETWCDILDRHPEWKQWRKELEEWAGDGFVGRLPPRPAVTEPAFGENGLKFCERTLLGRAVVVESWVRDSGESGSPARSVVEITRVMGDGQFHRERWLFAESWWAETFTAPSFAEFAEWGRQVIPWVIGSHFASSLRRALRRPRSVPNVARAVGAGVALLAAIVASGFAWAALVLLLVVALMPIPKVREWLLWVQLRVSATLGDSFILLERPIQAAAIVTKVRRDLEWLTGRCRGAAVVAHSQGAAVSHLVLQHIERETSCAADPPPPPGQPRGAGDRLRLLFTFGSGLKKLEQVRHLFDSGDSFIRSSIWTAVAMPFCAFGLAWFAMLPFYYSAGRTAWQQIPIMLGWVLITGWIVWAGVRDYIRGFDPPALRRWLARVWKRPFSWVDAFATSDPVSNGMLLEANDAESRREVEEMEKRSHRVCNRSSVISDHTTYWENRDEFVTFLISKLDADLRKGLHLPPATELETTPADFDDITRRRRWRIGVGQAIDWFGAGAVLISIYRAWPAWRELFAYWAARFYGWVWTLLGSDPAAPSPVTVHGPAVSFLILAVLPLWIAREFWTGWNDREMRTLVARPRADVENDIGVFMAMGFQITIAAGVASGFSATVMSWVLILTMIAVGVLMNVGERRSSTATSKRSAPSKSKVSGAEHAVTIIISTGMLMAMAGAIGDWFWMGVCWIARRLGGPFFGLDPERIASAAFGLGVAVVVGAVALWRQLKSKNPSASK